MKISDQKAFEFYKRMNKVICPECKGESKNCNVCEGEGFLLCISDELLKEIKENLTNDQLTLF